MSAEEARPALALGQKLEGRVDEGRVDDGRVRAWVRPGIDNNGDHNKEVEP